MQKNTRNVFNMGYDGDFQMECISCELILYKLNKKYILYKININNINFFINNNINIYKYLFI